jgi:hypothetical protein
MSKQVQQQQQHAGAGRQQRLSDAHEAHLLPPRPPLLQFAQPGSGEEAGAAAGLMTRVTSLFNRALCKPSSRGPSSPFLDDRHPAAFSAAKQQQHA